ncbi:MAG TPA: cyanophycin synthetase, partial [Acidimicrobiales bacterium]|nr:cyanophycin synthetase [Acidimicrobiales bacterium]
VNVSNALLAAEAAVALGLEPLEVARGLATVEPVPGRLEVVAAPGPEGPPIAVLVDYAHTPAGLEVVLGEGRRLAGTGRLLVVFGCGGDRDRAKRPLMGEVATRLADRVYLTSDNPRHEDAEVIIGEVLAGVDAAPAAVAGGRLVVDPDRRRAIVAAVADARPGDLLIVAGKGHETVQEIGADRLPFDDRLVAAGAVADRWKD